MNEAIKKLAAGISECDDEIERIAADARRRATPIQSRRERLQIAIEEVKALLMPETVPPMPPQKDAKGAPDRSIGKSTRQAIIDELSSAGLALSKVELMERFVISGFVAVPATVGSTLSVLTGKGVLHKVGPNRYALSVLSNETGPDEKEKATLN